MKKLLLILMVLLTSCTKPVYLSAGCPRVTLSPEPIYPTASLNKGDTPAKTIKAMVMTIKMQQQWINEAKIRTNNDK